MKRLKNDYKGVIMNFKEVIELLCNGKKVRNIYWDKSLYIYLNHDGILTWSDDFIGDINAFKEWEEYKEPEKLVDFPTALNHILNGGTAKREKNGIVYYFNEREVLMRKVSSGSGSDYGILDKEDITATDWILL